MNTNYATHYTVLFRHPQTNDLIIEHRQFTSFMKKQYNLTDTQDFPLKVAQQLCNQWTEEAAAKGRDAVYVAKAGDQPHD